MPGAIPIVAAYACSAGAAFMLTPEAAGDEGIRTDDEGTPFGYTTGMVPSGSL